MQQRVYEKRIYFWSEVKRVRRNKACFSNCVDSKSALVDIADIFALWSIKTRHRSSLNCLMSSTTALSRLEDSGRLEKNINMQSLW